MISKISEKIEIDKQKVRETIWILSIISPFQLHHQGAFLTHFLDIDADKLRLLLHSLIDTYLLHDLRSSGITLNSQNPDFLLLGDEQVSTDNKTYWSVPIVHYAIKPDVFAEQIINWFTDGDNTNTMFF